MPMLLIMTAAVIGDGYGDGDGQKAVAEAVAEAAAEADVGADADTDDALIGSERKVRPNVAHLCTHHTTQGT